MPARTARYIAHQVPTIVLTVAFALVAVQAVVTVGGWWSSWRDGLVERGDVLDYHGVGFVEPSEGALVFWAESTWWRPADSIRFTNRLWCDGRIRSSQRNEVGARDPRPHTRTLFDYTAAAPQVGSGAVCHLEVSVRAETRWGMFAQRVESEPFTL